MAYQRVRAEMIDVRCTAMTTVGACVAAVVGTSVPSAHADALAYLVNVTVRPGYYLANADVALRYGQQICHKTQGGRGFRQLIGDIAADFGTSDDYQASYLINQAVNELCRQAIWQLRNAAANYPFDPPPQPPVPAPQRGGTR